MSIRSRMKTYDYYLMDINSYGELALGNNVEGNIEMTINVRNQSNENDIRYSAATYIGLTHSTICDKMVIDYEGTMLKVLYINPTGRYTQVYMAEMV